MEVKKKPAVDLPTSETLSVLDQNEPQNGIEVICRIRPKFVCENYVNYMITDKRLDIYETNYDNEISNQKTFTFSQIYDQNSTQRNLHQEYVIVNKFIFLNFIFYYQYFYSSFIFIHLKFYQLLNVIVFL